MSDHAIFTSWKDKTFVVLAEIKTSLCHLNGAWTDDARGNINRVLAAVGCLPKDEIAVAARNIYKYGFHESQLYRISMACMGEREQTDYKTLYPEVPQILWNEVLKFIYRRFTAYRNEKSAHPQWDEVGHGLWDAVMDCKRRCSDKALGEQQFLEVVQVSTL